MSGCCCRALKSTTPQSPTNAIGILMLQIRLLSRQVPRDNLAVVNYTAVIFMKEISTNQLTDQHANYHLTNLCLPFQVLREDSCLRDVKRKCFGKAQNDMEILLQLAAAAHSTSFNSAATFAAPGKLQIVLCLNHGNINIAHEDLPSRTLAPQ